MLYAAQTHPACKSINSPGCSDYMKDNVNKDSHQEAGRRNIAVSNQENGGDITLEYIGPEGADVREISWDEDSTDTDDPKRGACSGSNIDESCEVNEVKHDEKGNINLPQAEAGNTEWKKGGQFSVLPPGNIAYTVHIHFPFRNRELPRCKQYIGDEDDEDCHSRGKRE